MFDNFTHDSRQNAERYYTNLEYRAEIDAKFASQQNFDDQRDLCTDDGMTPEAPRQVIQYHEKRPHSLGAFLIALMLVVGATILLFPFIIMFLFSF